MDCLIFNILMIKPDSMQEFITLLVHAYFTLRALELVLTQSIAAQKKKVAILLRRGPTHLLWARCHLVAVRKYSSLPVLRWAEVSRGEVRWGEVRHHTHPNDNYSGTIFHQWCLRKFRYVGIWFRCGVLACKIKSPECAVIRDYYCFPAVISFIHLLYC